MKFSACILTAGLLLAIAATVHSSFLNPFVKALGVLDDNNILPNTTACPPPDAPIGTIHTLTITDCTQTNYPCAYEPNENYTVIPTFTCGATHSNCRIVVTMDINGTEFTVFNVPSEPNPPLPVYCTPGKDVAPVFNFIVPSEIPLNQYDVKMKLFCDYGHAKQQLEVCRGITIVVNPSPGVP